MPRFLQPILEGTLYAVVIAALVAALGLALPVPEFASRWDSSCPGWTKTEAVWYVVGEALHWWSYVVVSMVIFRLHPILHTVPYSALTVRGVVLFVFGCGFGHLLEAVAVFVPAYRVVIGWLILNGLVSVGSAFLVAYSLVCAFDHVERHRHRASELERRFGQHLPGKES